MKTLSCSTLFVFLLSVRAGSHVERTENTRTKRAPKGENLAGRGTTAMPTEDARPRSAAAAGAESPRTRLFRASPTPRQVTAQITEASVVSPSPSGGRFGSGDGLELWLASQKDNPSGAGRPSEPGLPLISNYEKVVFPSTKAAFKSMTTGTLKVSSSAGSVCLHTLAESRNQREKDFITVTSADKGQRAAAPSAFHPGVIGNPAEPRHHNVDEKPQGGNENGAFELDRVEHLFDATQSVIQSDREKGSVTKTSTTNPCLPCGRDERAASAENHQTTFPASDTLSPGGFISDFNQHVPSLLSLIQPLVANQKEINRTNMADITKYSVFSSNDVRKPMKNGEIPNCTQHFVLSSRDLGKPDCNPTRLHSPADNKMNSSQTVVEYVLSDIGAAGHDANLISEVSKQKPTKNLSGPTYFKEYSVTRASSPTIHGPDKTFHTLSNPIWKGGKERRETTRQPAIPKAGEGGEGGRTSEDEKAEIKTKREQLFGGEETEVSGHEKTNSSEEEINTSLDSEQDRIREERHVEEPREEQDRETAGDEETTTRQKERGGGESGEEEAEDEGSSNQEGLNIENGISAEEVQTGREALGEGEDAGYTVQIEREDMTGVTGHAKHLVVLGITRDSTGLRGDKGHTVKNTYFIKHLGAAEHGVARRGEGIAHMGMKNKTSPPEVTAYRRQLQTFITQSVKLPGSVPLTGRQLHHFSHKIMSTNLTINAKEKKHNSEPEVFEVTFMMAFTEIISTGSPGSGGTAVAATSHDKMKPGCPAHNSATNESILPVHKSATKPYTLITTHLAITARLSSPQAHLPVNKPLNALSIYRLSDQRHQFSRLFSETRPVATAGKQTQHLIQRDTSKPTAEEPLTSNMIQGANRSGNPALPPQIYNDWSTGQPPKKAFDPEVRMTADLPRPSYRRQSSGRTQSSTSTHKAAARKLCLFGHSGEKGHWDAFHASPGNDLIPSGAPVTSKSPETKREPTLSMEQYLMESLPVSQSQRELNESATEGGESLILNSAHSHGESGQSGPITNKIAAKHSGDQNLMSDANYEDNIVRTTNPNSHDLNNFKSNNEKTNFIIESPKTEQSQTGEFITSKSQRNNDMLIETAGHTDPYSLSKMQANNSFVSFSRTKQNLLPLSKQLSAKQTGTPFPKVQRATENTKHVSVATAATSSSFASGKYPEATVTVGAGGHIAHVKVSQGTSGAEPPQPGSEVNVHVEPSLTVALLTPTTGEIRRKSTGEKHHAEQTMHNNPAQMINQAQQAMTGITTSRVLNEPKQAGTEDNSIHSLDKANGATFATGNVLLKDNTPTQTVSSAIGANHVTPGWTSAGQKPGKQDDQNSREGNNFTNETLTAQVTGKTAGHVVNELKQADAGRLSRVKSDHVADKSNSATFATKGNASAQTFNSAIGANHVTPGRASSPRKQDGHNSENDFTKKASTAQAILRVVTNYVIHARTPATTTTPQSTPNAGTTSGRTKSTNAVAGGTSTMSQGLSVAGEVEKAGGIIGILRSRQRNRDTNTGAANFNGAVFSETTSSQIRDNLGRSGKSTAPIINLDNAVGKRILSQHTSKSSPKLDIYEEADKRKTNSNTGKKTYSEKGSDETEGSVAQRTTREFPSADRTGEIHPREGFVSKHTIKAKGLLSEDTFVGNTTEESTLGQTARGSTKTKPRLDRRRSEPVTFEAQSSAWSKPTLPRAESMRRLLLVHDEPGKPPAEPHKPDPRRRALSDVHLSGVTEVSDDLCGSGNYTAEMRLRLESGIAPGDQVPALGNLRVVINLRTNNSLVNLEVTSCCLSSTVQPQLPGSICCLFSRLAAEPAGIRLLPRSLSTSASFTITLFQMINYSVVYLHCDLSICLRNRSGCERQCLREGSAPRSEGPEAIVTNLRNRISFGPMLKEEQNSSLPVEIDSSGFKLVLVVLSLAAGCSVFTATLLLAWLACRRRAAGPAQREAARRRTCCRLRRGGGDLILP